MTREEFVKDVIKETLYQVQEQGWDLLDTFDFNADEGVEKVYEEIKENYWYEDD
jgi:hypothetical protein